MNIGILVSGLPPEVLAGSELQGQQLAEQLAKRGHQVTVFTRSTGFYSSRMEQNGYTVHPRRVMPVKGLRMIWDMIAALWDIVYSSPRPRVLLCYQTIINGLIGVVAQILLGIPTIVSIRENREYQFYRPTPYQFPVRFVYRQAKSIIVQTSRMLEDLNRQLRLADKTKLSEIVQAKARIIPNGIHLHPKTFQKRARGTKVIYIGRLIPDKGIADLIEAVRQLPQVELTIIGDGPDRNRLELLAYGTSTSFVGRVSHDLIFDYLYQSRVLVLPSHLEGLPNVILEAMSCGVPVVATNTGGIPDVVNHGKTGFLYEPGDIGKLANYVNHLLEDDELHRKMGEQCLRAVQSYSWAFIAPQIEQLLLDCMDDRPV